MPLNLNGEQVLALAPDPAAAAAARKLAAGRVWSHAGHDARALWAECQGSATYQVRVDLADLAAKCSCPSRKFPCKHALGLMLLAASNKAAVPEGAAPEWVSEWLTQRTSAAERREKRVAASVGKPVDEKAQARRAERRIERVEEGLEGLELWMCDLVRNGLATAADQGYSFWENQAARLVDAQAPGLASRLRRLAEIPRNAPDWSRRVLGGLGRIALLIEAYRRLPTLDPALQDDVRSLIGWSLKDDEVRARGMAADDRWAVIGQRTEEDERLSVLRTWLLGLDTGRYALILQFAHGQAPFEHVLLPGTVFEARLRYWPSAAPLRALVEERRGGASAWAGPAPSFERLQALLAHATSGMASMPWLDRWPCVVARVRPARTSPHDWQLVDAAGDAVPLATSDNWKLAALSGGHPIDVAGEWDGETFLPLSVMTDGVFEALRG